MSWEERTTERSPAIQRLRNRTLRHARVIVDAAARLIPQKGDAFTTQELVKEAGVSLDTFYRYFASKDELLLAVIASLITGATERWTAASAELHDPAERLHLYITSIFEIVDRGGDTAATALFIASTHWRLQRILPLELAAAEQPLVDLMVTEIRKGQADGLLHPASAESAASFVVDLVRSVVFRYAHDPSKSDAVKVDLWNFCLNALGGTTSEA